MTARPALATSGRLLPVGLKCTPAVCLDSERADPIPRGYPRLECSRSWFTPFPQRDRRATRVAMILPCGENCNPSKDVAITP